MRHFSVWPVLMEHALILDGQGQGFCTSRWALACEWSTENLIRSIRTGSATWICARMGAWSVERKRGKQGGIR